MVVKTIVAIWIRPASVSKFETHPPFSIPQIKNRDFKEKYGWKCQWWGDPNERKAPWRSLYSRAQQVLVALGPWDWLLLMSSVGCGSSMVWLWIIRPQTLSMRKLEVWTAFQIFRQPKERTDRLNKSVPHLKSLLAGLILHLQTGDIRADQNEMPADCLG